MDMSPEHLVLRGEEIPRAAVIAVAGRTTTHTVMETLEVMDTPLVVPPERWLELYDEYGVHDMVVNQRYREFVDENEVWTIPIEQVPLFADVVQRAAKQPPNLIYSPEHFMWHVRHWAAEMSDTRLPEAGISLGEIMFVAQDVWQAMPADLATLLTEIEAHIKRIETGETAVNLPNVSPKLSTLKRSRLVLKLALQLRTAEVKLN